MIRILCVDVTDAAEGVYERLYANASSERKRRADRYLRREDKLRCVIADALLRAALGTGDFLTEKDDGGKPYVKGRENFHYNLSHSGRYVVIAWGDVPVGVDVQKHENTLDRRAVAEQSFAPDERIYAGESAERFFEVWTGKESYLKYTGEGLRRDMRSFSMFRTEPPVRLLSCLPHGGYSLCLCAADREYTFELSDVRQL